MVEHVFVCTRRQPLVSSRLDTTSSGVDRYFRCLHRYYKGVHKFELLAKQILEWTSSYCARLANNSWQLQRSSATFTIRGTHEHGWLICLTRWALFQNRIFYSNYTDSICITPGNSNKRFLLLNPTMNQVVISILSVSLNSLLFMVQIAGKMLWHIFALITSVMCTTKFKFNNNAHSNLPNKYLTNSIDLECSTLKERDLSIT